MTPTLCLFLTFSMPGAGPEILGLVPQPAPAEACRDLGWFRPQPGDLLIFQHTGALKNIIYTIGGSGGATHSSIIVARPDGSLGMLEAPGSKYPVMISDISCRMKFYPGKVWVRRRCAPLTPDQNRCLTEFACAQVGKPFDNVGFLIPMLGHPARKRPSCKPIDLDPKSWFCSALCVGAGVAAGLLDAGKVKPRFTDPQDLKNDRCLDISRCWEQPKRWHFCGPKPCCWWSQDCCGKRECWK